MLAPAQASGRQEAVQVLARIAREGEAFLGELVDRFHPALLRVARALAPARDDAEGLARATWMALLDGAPSCEGRSFRCWLFRTLLDQARRRAAAEGRGLDLSPGPTAPAVPAERFRGEAERYTGNWVAPPPAWPAEATDGAAALAAALERLPVGPRVAFALRDVEGCDAAEACDVLGVDEAHQRALLHQARSALRAALEERFGGART